MKQLEEVYVLNANQTIKLLTKGASSFAEMDSKTRMRNVMTVTCSIMMVVPQTVQLNASIPVRTGLAFVSFVVMDS